VIEIKAVAREVDLDGRTVIVGALTDCVPITGSESTLEEIDPRHLGTAGFEGKSGQVVAVATDTGVALVVGLGDEVTFDSLRAAAGNAIRAVKSETAVCLLSDADLDGALRAVVEGLALGSYQFRDYKTKSDGELKVKKVEVPGVSQPEIDSVLIGTNATNLSRTWTNTPAMDKAPAEIAGRIQAEAENAGLDVEVWDLDRIKEEKLGALLGVAAGSDRSPVLLTITYSPEDAIQHLGLVGKGITFDSGGLSLKTAAFMEEMKDDMSGAGVVAAATIAIARHRLPVRVTTVIPLTDNAVGGNATRPGDVLRPVAGPTIEVLNTDAEGRLILADGLGVVRRFEPDVIVDVATLTGAAKVALGDQIGAVFGSDSDVASLILDAASRAGETFWEMPLFHGYRKSLDSDIADIKNITGGRYGGAIAAALFLSEYAGKTPWAHLDIAGPARWRETAGEHVKGGSGFGVRTLLELAVALSGTD
jgi:leucyl aminopeptidase